MDELAVSGGYTGDLTGRAYYSARQSASAWQCRWRRDTGGATNELSASALCCPP